MGLFILVIFFGILFDPSVFSSSNTQGGKTGLEARETSGFIISENNALVALSNPNNPVSPVVRRLPAVITGYSSSPLETDDDPYITAAGIRVREGIVANNFFPFGTKIRIPELFGDRVFVVEDRMSWKKGNYHFDIWFPSYWQAKSFGAKRTYIEILNG